jgi:hypothetical protein
MYRREYPDVPGLFDARFSEYNRPDLVRPGTDKYTAFSIAVFYLFIFVTLKSLPGLISLV